MKISQAIYLITNSLYNRKIKNSIDRFISGNTEGELKGISTAFIATSEVIYRSVSLGCNLIITHEPVFYNHKDVAGWLVSSDVYMKKLKMINETGTAIFRLHDQKHKKSVDPVLLAFTDRLGWSRYRDISDYRIFNLPEVKLADLLAHIKSALGCNFLRYIGNTDMLCCRVGILVGSQGGVKQIKFVEENALDVLVCGEVNEWDVNIYINDSSFHGFSRALIVTGHEESERDAMELLAERIKEILPDYPSVYLPSSGETSFNVY